MRDIGNAQRVVIKLGTSTVVDRASGEADTRLLVSLVEAVDALINRGLVVVLVSSGAIGLGRRLLREESSASMAAKQALAAVGQPLLMNLYERLFGLYHRKVAQILLTREDLASRSRYLNARNTLTELISRGVLPVVNENDTVGVEEIRFGDNDTLAALVGTLIDADLILNLTDTDGLYDKDPAAFPGAKKISVVTDLDEWSGNSSHVGRLPPPDLPLQGGGMENDLPPLPSPSSSHKGRGNQGRILPGGGMRGTGGMATKLQAARIAVDYGARLVIADSRTPRVIERILDGEDLGTLFLTKEGRMESRKRWIAFAGKTSGKIVIDRGAAKALLEGGRSLLAVGVAGCSGSFHRGDLVEIVGVAAGTSHTGQPPPSDPAAKGQTIARGLVNYDKEDLEKIKGLPSSQIEQTLGFTYGDEVVHRNNLALGREK
ncbi:MAG: glutamate 5-kinase [Armatimonadetes bacterium]|nr:glutamate 5-kinase [Armatimonadota bacterium]